MACFGKVDAVGLTPIARAARKRVAKKKNKAEKDGI